MSQKSSAPQAAKSVSQTLMSDILTTFDNGNIVRTVVDPNKKQTRRPRRPMPRARVKDFTKKKRF